MRHLIVLLATVSAALAQSAQPASPANHYVPDKNHSTVAFEIGIMNGMSKVTGKFTAFDADLTYDPAHPTKSVVNVHIQCASIDTGIPDRDKDLRGPGFFDCEKNPELTFVSKDIKQNGSSLDVSGDFTMHGVTKPLTLQVTSTGNVPLGKGTEYGFAGTTRLNRRDYGMNWKHNAVPNFVADDVDIRLFFLFKPPPAPKPAAS